MSWSLQILGGGQEIGANSYLLGLDGISVLLDAGLHPKKYGRDSLPDFDLIDRGLEAVFISHAHLDHVGALPIIQSRQPQAPIFATIPTKDIALRMLHNTVTVMNISGRRRDTGNTPSSNTKTSGPWKRRSPVWNIAPP